MYLTTDEQALLESLRHDDVLERAYVLARHFMQLVRQHQPDALDAWSGACQNSGVSELKNFATGLQRAYSAVRAALAYEWSNGHVEGHVTRRKLIKRQMYGRASFDVLRKRILSVAYMGEAREVRKSQLLGSGHNHSPNILE